MTGGSAGGVLTRCGPARSTSPTANTHSVAPPQNRYIGTWSDGVPIIGLKIQHHAAIRTLPAPKRQPAPPPGKANLPPHAKLTSIPALYSTEADRPSRHRLGRQRRRIRAGRRCPSQPLPMHRDERHEHVHTVSHMQPADIVSIRDQEPTGGPASFRAASATEPTASSPELSTASARHRRPTTRSRSR